MNSKKVDNLVRQFKIGIWKLLRFYQKTKSKKIFGEILLKAILRNLILLNNTHSKPFSRYNNLEIELRAVSTFFIVYIKVSFVFFKKK